MPKRKTTNDQPEVIEGVEDTADLPLHILPDFGDRLREFDPDAIEPYTIIFSKGDTIDMRVELLCQPLFLEPFYAGKITFHYEGKRVTSLSRDHGIFRLWLEDGTQAAVISGQLLTVTKQAVQESVAEPAADGDAAG